ncbi:MAG: hypothetical protein LBB81_03805, partial [Treponema sp.]|nr:hypothetical protein [Treponema sp.]
MRLNKANETETAIMYTILSADPGIRHTPATAPRQGAFTGKCGTVRGQIKSPLIEKCIRHQASGIRHQASGIRHQASGIRHQASGIRHQASGIRH